MSRLFLVLAGLRSLLSFHRVAKQRWFTYGLLGSIVLGMALWSQTAVFAQENVTGLIFQGFRDRNTARLVTTEYTGECPGTVAPEVRTWFTSTATPTGRRRRVVIRNLTPGMSPDRQPFTDREYDEGTVSEPFATEFGTEHSNRRFRVLEGENELQYEVRERNTVLETNTFTAFFENVRRTERRDSQQQTQQVCANSSVAMGACADVRSRTQWTCPGGQVLRQQLQPQGPTRTVLSNQSFSPISFRVQGRFYYLNPGQSMELQGDNLGTIQYVINSQTNQTQSYSITAGTRYRFTSTNNQIQLSEWYR